MRCAMQQRARSFARLASQPSPRAPHISAPQSLEAMNKEEPKMRNRMLRLTRASLSALCEKEGVTHHSELTKAFVVDMILRHWRERLMVQSWRHKLDARPARLTAQMLGVGGIDEAVAEVHMPVLNSYSGNAAPTMQRSQLRCLIVRSLISAFGCRTWHQQRLCLD